MSESGRRVLIGRIVGLYGVQGWLKIESWAEPRMKIFDYQPWLLNTAPGVETQIAGAKGRQQGKGMVAQLPGIDDREQAAALIGMDIHVDRGQLPPPGKDEYYWVDLEGLEVVTTEDVVLGRVSHLFATGANDVVVVRDGERERLIPFIQRSYVRSVDLSAKRMVVDWDPEF
ncbi:ribosome maturation factor RimM [Rhodanobacter sp. MP1X3]|uniref:ribosome maturation factor RimM n=1 Tax=Rhodanobacter sp. MP1X3 TaxID=2723086 RepID=UPI00161FB6FF|nr:ribosome maturation factor RimM [Rhodanobacter sp. MP1X3]MBB6244061.1 16S rRNA processing protein RimM [Rhodanobacter sp. MP1X3]